MVCRQHGANSLASKMIIIHLDVIQHEHYKYIIASKKTKWAQIHRDTLAGGFDDAKTIRHHPSTVVMESWSRQKKNRFEFWLFDFQMSVLRYRIRTVFFLQVKELDTDAYHLHVERIKIRWVQSLNSYKRPYADVCTYTGKLRRKIGNNCENDPFIDYISQLRCLVNTRACAVCHIRTMGSRTGGVRVRYSHSHYSIETERCDNKYNTLCLAKSKYP